MFICQTNEEQNVVIKRATADSENTRITEDSKNIAGPASEDSENITGPASEDCENITDPASLGNTELPNPFSWLLSKCSQPHNYGSGWSQLADPPPHSCDEASSAYPTGCIICEGTRDQISLQGNHSHTPAAEKRDEKKEKHSQRSQTLDSSWAWVVLQAAFFITLFMMNTSSCFSILFSQKMFELSASSTNVSIIFTANLIMRQCGNLITNSLVSQFGYRKVAFWSCFLGSASIMILAFSPSLIFLFINYSIVHGMTSGIATMTSVMIVPHYFERRRGFALAVIMTGIAVGGMVLPMLVRSLQDEFGFVGGVLLLGAIISNCCVAALMYRPPPISKKKEPYLDSLLRKDIQKNNPTNKYMIWANMKRLFASAYKNIFLWLMRTYEVFQQLSVKLIGLSFSTMGVALYNFLMLVPFSVESSGKSPTVSAWYLIAFATAYTGSSLLMIGLAERTWVNKRVVMVFGALLASLSVIAFVLVSSEQEFITTMHCFGFGIGLYWSVFHAHTIEVLGLELFKEAYGINSICMAVMFAAVGPILGVIRDLSGSYSWSIFSCAGLMLLSAILLLSLSLASDRNKKENENN